MVARSTAKVRSFSEDGLKTILVKNVYDRKHYLKLVTARGEGTTRVTENVSDCNPISEVSDSSKAQSNRGVGGYTTHDVRGGGLSGT